MKQFSIPAGYRSPLISRIKERRREQDKLKKDFSPTLLDLGSVRIFLARHFGFCYGVENAIEIAFRTVEENPGKRIFLLSEMIHNPQVNADLQSRGVRFLNDTKGNPIISLDEITGEDIVLIPAFGTTLDIEEKLRQRGISIEKYNTTCPFVEKVWNRGEQIAKKKYSLIVHGKPTHEETRATFSHAAANTATVVINDMNDAIILAGYISGEKDPANFYTEFAGRYSEGFDAEKDLQRIGVINQTTMLAADTQAIAEYLKQAIIRKYDLSPERVAEHFADTRDTLCYATNDNQSAVYGLLEQPADLAIIVGGYNSSNTSHLVELCEEKLPTFFINAADKIIDRDHVLHFDLHTHAEKESQLFLGEKRPLDILISSGASCPDAIVENVIERIAMLCGETELFDRLRSVEAMPAA